MAADREKVQVEREDEEGKKKGWRNAWLELDHAAGTISLESAGGIANKFAMTLAANQLDGFEIIQISEVNTLAAMYGGGLLGYGIAWLMSRWVKVPAVRLTQQSAPPGEQWVNLRAPGTRVKKTQAVAQRIDGFLRERGYQGMMPDVQNEELWKNPAGKILVGCAAVIVVLLCLFVVFALFVGTGS